MVLGEHMNIWAIYMWVPLLFAKQVEIGGMNQT